jgi:hypothetical protein
MISQPRGFGAAINGQEKLYGVLVNQEKFNRIVTSLQSLKRLETLDKKLHLGYPVVHEHYTGTFKSFFLH